ncbi:MAG: hypothetical protein K0Q74_952 [Gammaproteobacteria bacterium]|jgi:hypothetical protein|nr:hypothetical protein [Gammaproteobacteria bacterium]
MEFYYKFALNSQNIHISKETFMPGLFGFFYLLPRVVPASFFETRASTERQAYRQALDDYTREVAKQTDEIRAVQEGLIRCLEENGVRNRELLQDQKLLMQRGTIDGFWGLEAQKEFEPEEHKLVPSLEDEERHQKAMLIRQYLITYPALPEYGQLSAVDIRALLNTRMEHHAALMDLARQFIPETMLDAITKSEKPVISF